jgi:hypothetical protein
MGRCADVLGFRVKWSEQSLTIVVIYLPRKNWRPTSLRGLTALPSIFSTYHLEMLFCHVFTNNEVYIRNIDSTSRHFGVFTIMAIYHPPNHVILNDLNLRSCPWWGTRSSGHENSHLAWNDPRDDA